MRNQKQAESTIWADSRCLNKYGRADQVQLAHAVPPLHPYIHKMRQELGRKVPFIVHALLLNQVRVLLHEGHTIPLTVKVPGHWADI